MSNLFDFKLLKEADCKRIYKDSVFKYISSNKDKVFSVIDEYADTTHHTYSMIDDYFTKNPIKSAMISKDRNTIYIECMKNKAGKQERYILLNRKVNA